jgi:bacterioferritin-associated ferredoxin
MNERNPQGGHHSNGESVLDPVATLTCRCEEILGEEIVAAIAAGARSVDDVKRRTRAGMGSCQGTFCVPVIAAMVAQATGVPIDRIAPLTARPPVRPLALESLANVNDFAFDQGELSARDDKERP